MMFVYHDMELKCSLNDSLKGENLTHLDHKDKEHDMVSYEVVWYNLGVCTNK